MRKPVQAATDGRARVRFPASRRSRARAQSTIRPGSSNAEIAVAANYVTARFGVEGSRLTAQNVAALRLTR